MNKKGFTLIELLTVIVVLAAISLVVIPSVNSSLNKSNEQAYDAQISSIENAAKSWLADNISEIPDNGEEHVLTLGELQDGNYKNCNSLSIGTIDQMYLALRLSALEEITKEKIPILLDEAFCYYDEKRLENILKILYNNYDNQIIIFTCTKREKEILDKMKVKYNYTEI